MANRPLDLLQHSSQALALRSVRFDSLVHILLVE